MAKNQNTQTIAILNKEKFDCINLVDGIIQSPINGEILASTINSHFKIKKSLDRLYENNKELSRSLYQLNVLYNLDNLNFDLSSYQLILLTIQTFYCNI